MAAPRILPDGGTLLQHRRQGWSLDEIAATYGVTKGAVYLQLKAIPGATRTRPNHKGIIPWTVEARHHHVYPAAMLRLYSRREGLSGGAPEELSPRAARMLERWLRDIKTRDVVVDYDPNILPNPASPKHGGWAYRLRRPEDGDNLIRHPDVRALLHERRLPNVADPTMAAIGGPERRRVAIR